MSEGKFFIIVFSTKVPAGSYLANYYITDSNRIIIQQCADMVVGVHLITKTGHEINLGFFFDSLRLCNRFLHVDNEIRFYRDTSYRLTVKPYYDLLPFPERKNLDQLKVKEIKVDSITSEVDDYLIINSQHELEKHGVGADVQDVDFQKETLVVVRNVSVQKNRLKAVRKLSRIQRKAKNEPFYPVSYAKFYYNDSNETHYLDISNTYRRMIREDISRRGIHSGFIVKKVEGRNLNVEVVYSE